MYGEAVAVGMLLGSGQVIEGGALPLTVTEKVHIAGLLALSTAMHVTVVLPVNVAPDGGEQSVELMPEASVAFKAKVNTAEAPLVGLMV